MATVYHGDPDYVRYQYANILGSVNYQFAQGMENWLRSGGKSLQAQKYSLILFQLNDDEYSLCPLCESFSFIPPNKVLSHFIGREIKVYPRYSQHIQS